MSNLAQNLLPQNMQSTMVNSIAPVDRQECVPLMLAQASTANTGIIDLRDACAVQGADLRQILLEVTAWTSGDVHVTLDYYPAVGTTSIKQVAEVITLGAVGISAYSIPVADQVYPRIKITLTIDGVATANVYYAYTTKSGKEI